MGRGSRSAIGANAQINTCRVVESIKEAAIQVYEKKQGWKLEPTGKAVLLRVTPKDGIVREVSIPAVRYIAERLQIQFSPEITDNVGVYYSNHVRVGHSEHEFTLIFFQSPPILKPEQLELAKKGEPIPLEPLVQILLPVKVGARLIKALISQKEKFEEAFGSLDEGETG